MEENKKQTIKICKNCNKEFVASYPNVQVCDECKKTYHKKETFCLECGKSIWSRDGKKKFCSTSCRSKYNARIYNPFKDNDLKDTILKNRKEFYKNKESEEYKNALKKNKNTRIKNAGSIENSYNQQIEKRRKTNLEKHGTENYVNADKISLTLQSRSEKEIQESREKAKNTCIEKYGVDSYSKTQEYKEKAKETFLEHYGVEHYSETEEYKKNLKEKMLLKYGVDCYTKTDEYKKIREKQREERINSLGYATSNQASFKEEYLNLLYDEEKATNFVKDKNYSIKDLVDILEASYTSILHWVKRNNLKDYIKWEDNHYEKEIREYLTKNNIDFISNDRKVLNGLELDIYIPSKNIAIEFNGTYWHSSLQKDKYYHFNKSKECEAKNIRLIHIWEYEWNNEKTKNNIISLLNIALGINPVKIYARNCVVKKIENKEAKPFNELNHLQGHRNAQVTYGLFHNNKLIQLMSFSKTKYNRNLKDDDSWEIIRGCPGSNNIVIGGVSKLFKHFIKDYKPNIVFSYCDFNKFNGKGYTSLGMNFIGYTGPDKHYIIGGKVYNRNPKKYHEFKEKSDFIIWGAGSKKYIWEEKDESIR